jgi:hypothetical protein
MPGIVRTDSIASYGQSGTIVIPTGNKMVGTSANVFMSPPRAGEIVRQVSSNASTTSALTITSLTETDLGLKIWITPEYASSKILVEWYSQMIYGAANYIILQLYRSTNGGSSFVNLTPFTNTSSRYAYGWNYNSNAWAQQKVRFVDTPGVVGNVVYKLSYRNGSSTATNYLVDQYMEYGWNLTEIAQ